MLVYASRPADDKNESKNFKKQEKTSWQNEVSMVNLKSYVMNGLAGSATSTETNLKKIENKSWQMRQDVLIYKSSSESKNLSVPCKLNNVKTNYNTLDNYNGLFKNRV